MTRKRTRPAPDEVRCPECDAITWRRAGESVTVVVVGQDDRELHHEFTVGGPWNWTCATCGYEVRPAGALDNALSRVQPVRVPAIIGGLLGLGEGAGGAGAGGDAGAGGSSTGLTPVQVVTAVVGVGTVTAVGVAAALGLQTPTPSAQPSREIREVDMEDVRVTRVTGDRTFWIDGEEGEMLVVLDEERQPEEDVTVRAGDDVSITGTTEPTPPEGTTLSEADQNALRDDPVYIRAVHVTVVGDGPRGSPTGESALRNPEVRA